MFDPELTRSPLLISPETSSLLVIDLQEKLLPTIPQNDSLLRSVRLLMDAANLLNVPITCTEQYPKGLGETVPEIKQALQEPPKDKTLFSCRQCLPAFEGEADHQRPQVILTGIETHVCVLQTALDLMGIGMECFLVVDAVGSRFALDREVAINRLEASGVTLTTTESVLFEWCQDSRSPHFKQISQWVKERQR